jgi:hypothetical protein
VSPEEAHQWRVLRVTATRDGEAAVVVSVDERHTVTLDPDQAANLAADIIAAVIAATREEKR